MSSPAELVTLIDSLADALGSGCGRGCMKNAVMCRIFAPDFSTKGFETFAAMKARAKVDPCTCWCHTLTFKVRPGVAMVGGRADV